MINQSRCTWIIAFLHIILGASGCGSILSHEKVAQVPHKDVVLAMEIKAKLVEEPQISAAAIHVEATNGLVILSGFVETSSQRQLANSIAQQVPGVIRIDNQIQVK